MLLFSHISQVRGLTAQETQEFQDAGRFFIYFIVWLKTLRNSRLIQFVTNVQ